MLGLGVGLDLGLGLGLGLGLLRFRVRVRVKVSDFQNNIWRHLLNILNASHSRGIAIFSYPIKSINFFKSKFLFLNFVEFYLLTFRYLNSSYWLDRR